MSLWHGNYHRDIIMANNFFLRKLAQDELWDTIFFASGEVPTKTKSNAFVELQTKRLDVKIYTDKNIYVNGSKFKSINDVKRYIQLQII